MTYFNRRGALRHIKSLRYWGLDDVLRQKYHFHPIEAKNLASFLLPMLKLAPEERATAQQLLLHPWLRGLPGPEAAEVAANSNHPSAGLSVLPVGANAVGLASDNPGRQDPEEKNDV